MKYLVNYKAYESETYVLLEDKSDALFRVNLAIHLAYVPYHDLRIKVESGEWKTVEDLYHGT